MQALVFKRQVQKQRNSFIRSFLIFDCHIQKDVVPAGSPVCRQAFRNSLRPFRQQQKNDIASPAHDIPCFIAPCISFLQEKIRCHADTDHFTALYLVAACPVPGQRIPESCLCSVNICPVSASHRINIVYITVLTSFTAFYAAVPGIPITVHCHLFFLIKSP